MAKIHNNTVARDAKTDYKTFITSVEEKTKTFLTDGEIQMKHLEAEKNALDYFDKNKMEDEEASTSLVLIELKKVGFYGLCPTDIQTFSKIIFFYSL